MDVRYVNPFIEAVDDIFSTMLGSVVVRGTIALSNGMASPRSLVAFIALSGPVSGIVSLHLPSSTAIKIVNSLLDTDGLTVDDAVLDGIAELVNIIAGGAKAKLTDGSGPPADLGLPVVVRGARYQADPTVKSKWLEIPFTSGLGPFCLRVALEG
jgi:chemotaxis protein CheX